uniref:Integrase catalytic domain-containing protein n=1 Tax=Neogobius melanostomus TaxID=47308 RepID=A0A8C6SYJ0_9GOBI
MAVLLKEWIPIFGVPSELHSDSGTHFTAHDVKTLCSLLGINKSFSCVYYPKGNAKVERMNRSLKSVLAKMLRDNPKATWLSSLSVALLHLRSTVNNTTNFTPFELMFGRAMPGCLPKSNSAPLPEVINIFQFRPYFEPLQSLLKELTPIVTTDTNVSDYTAGLPSQVYIKNHNRTRWDAPRYLGPFEVTQRTDTAVKVLVAPFCFKRDCRKGDWLLGKTPCLDYLGDGFTNREETWATRVAKLHSELVNTTELKCSDCMVIGQRWPLNHTTWTKLVQKTLTYSPWIPVPPRWGFPTPVGQVWLCGSNSYLTLPVDWCGTCTLARLKAMLKVGDRTLGQSYVPFSDNGGRKPLFGDGRGLLATLVPMIGVAASMQRLNEVWWILEDLTEVIDGILDQMERSPELKAVAAVAIQNRVALDALYAEQGGMCAAVGIDHCCTYIPDDTGNWTAIRNRVKELKDFLESQEDQGPQWTWLNWLNSGSWIHILQKVGIFIGIVLLFCCILFCFVVPLIRSMVSRALGSTGGIYMVSCARRTRSSGQGKRQKGVFPICT